MSRDAVRPWAGLAITCALVLAVDQAAKELVVSNVAPGERRDLVFGVDLVNVSNEGIAFGLLDAGGWPLLAVIFVSLGLVLAWFAFDPLRPGMWLGVGLMVGGALGNLLDRAREGGVTDFIDPPLWPAFNIADVAITVGVAVIAFAALAPREDAEPRA